MHITIYSVNKRERGEGGYIPLKSATVVIKRTCKSASVAEEINDNLTSAFTRDRKQEMKKSLKSVYDLHSLSSWSFLVSSVRVALSCKLLSLSQAYYFVCVPKLFVVESGWLQKGVTEVTSPTKFDIFFFINENDHCAYESYGKKVVPNNDGKHSKCGGSQRGNKRPSIHRVNIQTFKLTFFPFTTTTKTRGENIGK